jgi:tetratricopeptide (TPR) repeat protein
MSKFKNFITNHFNLSVFLIFAVVIFSLYGISLSFDYTYYDDDVLILDKQEYLTFSNIKNIVSNTVFGEGMDVFCRPILNITFLFEKYFYGIRPFGYHLTNLILHLFAVFSIFLFLTLRYDKKKTLLLCLLFACHPALVQTVAWIPGRNDSLLTLFIMLSCYNFIEFINKNKYHFLFLHLICFSLSLLTKETAIIMPIFYFFFLVLQKQNLKKYFIYPIIWSLIILLYLLYRGFVLSYQINSITFKSLIINFFNSLPALTKYIANVFFPLKLSIFPAMLDVNYLLCVASILMFVLMFIKLKKYNVKFVLFGIFWFLLLLFPTFLMPNNQFYDHRIYLPLIGVLILLLELLKEYMNFKKILYCSLMFFIIFSCILLFYEQKFQNKEVFWINALISSPESDVANAMVAELFFEKGLYKEAEKRYLKAISLKEHSKHYVNLSVVYAKEGNLDDAEKALLKSLSLSGDNPNTYYNLSLIYKYKGNMEKYEEMKNKYIEIFNKTNKISKVDLTGL